MDFERLILKKLHLLIILAFWLNNFIFAWHNIFCTLCLFENQVNLFLQGLKFKPLPFTKFKRR